MSFNSLMVFVSLVMDLEGGVHQHAKYPLGIKGLWIDNAISVVIFHFSWKMQSDIWGSISDQRVLTHIMRGNFGQSSITLLMDYY
jgi:photosystem I P700 chlorophyll a apoprotein A1